MSRAVNAVGQDHLPWPADPATRSDIYMSVSTLQPHYHARSWRLKVQMGPQMIVSTFVVTVTVLLSHGMWRLSQRYTACWKSRL